jgi:hypothetical protein
MAEETKSEGWAYLPNYVVGAIVGALVFVVAPETTRWLNGGALAQAPTPIPTPPNVNQYNQGAPNFNVPGNSNQFNFYNKSPEPTSDTMIYQAGVVVGKAFGARRLPNDATHFQFAEITNCAQFNTGAPFTYGGIRMIFEKEENSAYMVVGRPDSPIRYGVLARVLE